MAMFTPVFKVDLPPEMSRGAPDVLAYNSMAGLPVILRTNGIRMLLYACSHHIVTDAEARAGTVQVMERAVAAFAQARDAMLGSKPMPGLHSDALKWMREVIGSSNLPADCVAGLHEMGVNALHHMREGEALQPDNVRSFIAYGYGPFHEQMVQLEAAIRTALEHRKAYFQRSAEDARLRAETATAQIDDIARTVRLISLNASVEAARCGEAGLGFKVIAQEIKSLSEATESAAAEARAGIDAMREGLRDRGA